MDDSRQERTLPLPYPPRVSVIIPCYNEAMHIEACLESLMDDFVRKECEVLVVDGGSQDTTCHVIERLKCEYPNLRLLHNPKRLQSHGLNIGLQEARGEVVVRADAHSIYPQEYVQRCVGLLERTGADNVGGVMVPQGRTPFEQAVSRAMSHKLGIGGTRFHLGNYSGPSDTVYLGTFPRSIFDSVGPYDPQAHPAEDAELNVRIHHINGVIHLDSTIRVDYTPRSTFRALARQFFGYGRARCYIFKKHGTVMTLTRIVPVVLAFVLLTSLAASALHTLWWLVIPTFYGLYLLIAGLVMLGGDPPSVRTVLLQAAVIGTIHVCHGLGFGVKLLKIVR